MTVVHALKEPAKSKALARTEFSYNAAAWTAGEQGKKVAVRDLAGAGK